MIKPIMLSAYLMCGIDALLASGHTGQPRPCSLGSKVNMPHPLSLVPRPHPRVWGRDYTHSGGVGHAHVQALRNFNLLSEFCYFSLFWLDYGQLKKLHTANGNSSTHADWAHAF